MNPTSQINKKILAKDGKAIETLFKTDSKKTLAILQTTSIEKLRHPFDKIIPLYYSKNYEEAAGMLNYVEFDEKWAFPIYKKMFYRLYVLSEQKEEYAKILVNMFRKFQGKDKPLYLYLINMLIAIYLKNKKFNLIDNLLSIVDLPDFVSRESVVYYFYLGLNKLMRDDFQGAYVYLRKAFSYKFIREAIAFPFFICIALNRRKIRAKMLEKYKLNMDFLSDLYVGKLELAQLPTQILIEHSLLRVARVYLPLISARNHVWRLYRAMNSSSRVEIRYLMLIMNADMAACCAVLIQLISFGYVKGYLSVNKECLVLSKVDPFPTGIPLKNT